MGKWLYVRYTADLQDRIFFRIEQDLQDIREYIAGNPIKWEEDEENPDKILRV
jgi:hypothetical protein